MKKYTVELTYKYEIGIDEANIEELRKVLQAIDPIIKERFESNRYNFNSSLAETAKLDMRIVGINEVKSYA